MKLMSRCVNGNTLKIASVNTAGKDNELNQFFNHSVTIFRKNIGRFIF